MLLEVGRVELAAGPDITRRLAGHDAGAAEAVEALRRRAGAALQDPAYDLAEFLIPSQQDEDAAQVVAEDPFVVRGLCLKGGDVQVVDVRKGVHCMVPKTIFVALK